MQKKFLTFVMVLILIISFLLPTSVAKATPPNCSCVEYIRAYFGITESIGNAYQTGSWFLNHNFLQVSKPVVGAVAVMQPGFPGADTTYGHVGIVVSVVDKGTQWQIKLKGANQTQGETIFNEFGCSNVRNTAWRSYDKGNTKIKYYVIDNVAVRSLVTRSGVSNLYFSIQNGSKVSGAYLTGWNYTTLSDPLTVINSSQAFNLVRYGSAYRIISRRSAMCVVPNSANVDSKLVQKVCTGGNLEKWYFIGISGSGAYGTSYLIRNYQTGYAAKLLDMSLTPGTYITDSTYNSSNISADSLWFLEKK